MEVIIRRPGMLTTVQDLGRPGHRADGVPRGGAVDRFALRLANLLVGNEENAPALEFTMIGPEIEFSRDALVAVTGADFGIPLGRPFRVHAHRPLRFEAARSGSRGYLAVAGGFDVPAVLGGASAYTRGGFDGLAGRALLVGDVLRAPEVTRHVAQHWRVDDRILPDYHSAAPIRVVRGAQAGEFAAGFLQAEFTVTAQSDRMGCRLQGPVLLRASREDLRSRAVTPGTVQVPPDGQPIILLADAQTLGGYPQIAHVIEADQPRVGQLRPGDKLGFREVSLAEAHEATLAREQALALLKQGLAQKLR